MTSTLVILVAVALGGVFLRALDRYETRRTSPAPRRRRGMYGCPRFRASLTPFELIARGQVARWDDTTVERVRKAMR